nr:venom protein U-MPTX.11-19 [Megalopyge opercularis]
MKSTLLLLVVAFVIMMYSPACYAASAPDPVPISENAIRTLTGGGLGK